MEQKIQAKFDLLPLNKMEEVCAKVSEKGDNLPHLWQKILDKLPKIDDAFKQNPDFTNWLDDENNWVFLPFVWDVIQENSDLPDFIKLKYKLATQILAKLVAVGSQNRYNNLSGNLLYANFNGVNLAGVYLWAADLTGAQLGSMKGAKLNFAIAVGADFRGALDFEIEQLINLGSLYRTKFSIDEEISAKKFSADSVKVLEEKIIYNYKEALCKRYVRDDFGTEEEKQRHAEDVILPLLKLIALSDPEFRPLKWGIKDDGFHTKFDLLYQNHANLLPFLKAKIEAVVPKENVREGSYYQDRLNRKDWKPIFAQTPRKDRAFQIQQLQGIAACKNLAQAVEILANVKKEIEQERNIWDSELLKKINETIQGIVFDNNLRDTIAKSRGNKR